MFSALIRYIKFVRKPKNALGSMNVILLHGNHRHVLSLMWLPQGGESKNSDIIIMHGHNSTFL